MAASHDRAHPRLSRGTLASCHYLPPRYEPREVALDQLQVLARDALQAAWVLRRDMDAI
jgi:hypothetical protein